MFKLVVLLSVVAFAAAKPNVLAPLAYSAAVPVSSVSQYSSSVLHGSPVVPAVYGASVYGAPSVYGASVYGAPSVYSAQAVHGVPAVYGTLAQAPNTPAVVLDAVHGVPLDTPEVVAARAAHYQAKALSGHHLRKRNVSPLAYSTVVSPVSHGVVSAYSTPLVSSYSSPVVSAYSAPLVSHYGSPVVSAYSSPALVGSPLAYSAVAPRALSVHPW